MSKIYNINISNIKKNKLNESLSIDGIEELKENIKENGLKTPLSVVNNNDGTFRLIAGHRRLESIKMLFEEGYKLKFGVDELDGVVPCIFDTKSESEADELKNIMASNTDVRSLTPDDVRRLVNQAEMLLELEARNGKKYEGKKRDAIAKMINVSPRTVQKYLSENKDNVEQKNARKKVDNVDKVINNINKIIDSVKSIDIEEYGKTDRIAITSALAELAKTAKKIK